MFRKMFRNKFVTGTHEESRLDTIVHFAGVFVLRSIEMVLSGITRAFFIKANATAPAANNGSGLVVAAVVALVVALVISLCTSYYVARHQPPFLEKAQESLPPGTIVAYYPGAPTYEDSRLKVPLGWTVCDGKRGTPDLVNRFILGGDPTKKKAKALHQTGGSKRHSHDVRTTCWINPNIQFTWKTRGSRTTVLQESIPDLKPDNFTGETDHMPPYYTLVYIMKLSSPTE